MNERYMDFDNAQAEQAGEPVTFKKGGVLFSLPPTMPLGVQLLRLRMIAESDPNKPVSDVLFADALQTALGPMQWETFKQVCSTYEEYIEILKFVFASYGFPIASGNPEAPTESGATQSLNTGDSSKPTSSESTT